MRFQSQITRKSRKKKRRLLPLLIPAFLIAIALSLYIVNMKLAPIYVRYAEVQTQKIAAHVINKAITSQDLILPSVEEMFPAGSNDSTGVIKLNTEAVNRVVGDIHALVATHLEQAESGNFDMLPMQDNIEYDPQAMEREEGIVFFVPIGQALNIPLLGSLGPKIPIRFHVIGNVHTEIESSIKEFGINSASVEVNVVLTVNVQIIVPLATQESIVEQRVLVAMGIIPGTVPPVYSGGGGAAPNVEIPVQLPKQE